MNDMSIKILAAGLVDEGLYIEELEKKYKELQDIISKNIPTCPVCKKNMTPQNFSGYYDSFSFWECNCEKFSDDILKKYSGRNSHGAYN
jgi:hypothetical protein